MPILIPSLAVYAGLIGSIVFYLNRDAGVIESPTAETATRFTSAGYVTPANPSATAPASADDAPAMRERTVLTVRQSERNPLPDSDNTINSQPIPSDRAALPRLQDRHPSRSPAPQLAWSARRESRPAAERELGQSSVPTGFQAASSRTPSLSGSSSAQSPRTVTSEPPTDPVREIVQASEPKPPKTARASADNDQPSDGASSAGPTRPSVPGSSRRPPWPRGTLSLEEQFYRTQYGSQALSEAQRGGR